MNTSTGLSVIVITRNEEKDIAGCLESVKSIADEIIVVDSGSIDKTVEICKKYTDKVFNRAWSGYSQQKQYALDQSQGPWVLNIDADERVTPALQEEIKRNFERGENNNCNGYTIPFRHYFLGKRLRFGGSAGETHIRLFRKNKSAYGKSRIHEGIQVQAPLKKLASPVDHFSYRSIEEYLNKCNLYTSLIAAEKHAKGERFRLFHILRLPYEFVMRYFLKLGFLDGKNGLIYALLSSYYVTLKFLKLKDLEEKNT